VLDFLASLLDFAFIVGLAWVLLRTLWRFSRGSRKVAMKSDANRGRAGARTAGGETARDPICGMFVSTEVSHRLIQGGETLHFCSEECLHKYQESAVKN
jgi:YHS domain-containing protein